MKKIKLISKQDIKYTKICLDYVFHRLTKHKCGISDMISIETINRLRKQFE